jgi:hypothetical protein
LAHKKAASGGRRLFYACNRLVEGILMPAASLQPARREKVPADFKNFFSIFFS